MPEEKKKDSFTFSDKIKNSKPAASKSFANRISSKIGSDGKPKKTLFERTKRDAPFFIAAIVALLLLPFLYKYSGTVSEEPLVTPGSEESMFDPERYGFDTVAGDPEGQIAQLAGRDPLSLIKGFGSGEEASDDSHLYDIDRSGLDDSQSYVGTSVEENNTNIYKRNAAPATRAAFRRAATKINSLPSAGLNSRGGGKLGVGMWGGGLKTAAKKVGAEAPRTSPKPVSLQPLQAAGKPSRSYFGQGAAAEARRSRDAMSKGNAMQALMDAQMKPIEPGKIGGLTGGAFGPGGGNGDLKRSFAFNGKEPWWWDMMKKRSQMEWEAEFNRKWDWIKWKDKLLQGFLNGVLSCLFTGTDDWSMGNMFGAIEGGGDAAKCGEYTKEQWEKCTECMKFGAFGKQSCKMFISQFGENSVAAKKGWQGGNVAGATMGPIMQRIDCLSNGLGAALTKRWFGNDKKGALSEANDCSTFAMDGIYRAVQSGKGDWSVFHYVVGIPTDKLDTYYKVAPDVQRQMLVVGYLHPGTTFNAKIPEVADRAGFIPLFVESVAIKSKKLKDGSVDPKYKKDYNDALSNAEEARDAAVSSKRNEAAADLEKALQACVQSYPDSSSKGYKECVQKARGTADGTVAGASQKAKKQYKKDKASAQRDRNNAKAVYNIRGGDLPEDVEVALTELTQQTSDGGLLSYTEFLGILRQGGAIRDAYKTSTNATAQLSLSTKGAKEGKGFVTGARCAYPLARISCDFYATANTAGTKEGQSALLGSTNVPFAHLSFANGMQGNAKAYEAMQDKFVIVYKVQSNGNEYAKALSTDNSNDTPQAYVVPHADVRPFEGTWRNEDTGRTNSLGTAKNTGLNYQVLAKTLPEGVKGKRLILNWEIRQCPSIDVDGSVVTKGGCHNGTVYNNTVDKEGNVTSRTAVGQSLPGEVVSSASCVYFDDTEVSSSEIERQPIGECDAADAWQKSEKCCLEKMPGYTWKNGQCVPPAPPVDEGGQTPDPAQVVSFLAPKPSWVPASITGRKAGTGPSKEIFDGGFLAGNAGNNCDVMDGFILNSNTAKNYVDAVVTAYNSQHANLPLKTQNGSYAFSGRGGFPTVGEFIDAMNIASSMGRADVPKQAVCALGRAVMAASEDRNVPQRNWIRYNGQTYAPRNPFGSFLDYIGEEAAFWPAPYYIAPDGEEKCDMRFLYQAWKEEGKPYCTASGVAKKYHWGAYSSNAKPNSAYRNSSAGRKAGYPLAAMSKLGQYTPEGTSSNARQHDMRKAYHLGTGYKSGLSNNGANALVRDDREASHQELRGDSCSYLYGEDETMKVANVLTYVQAVCTNGLNYKPSGDASDRWWNTGNSGRYTAPDGSRSTTVSGVSASDLRRRTE